MGGGKVLLDQLLTENNFGEVEILICDERYILPAKISSSLKVYRVMPTLVARWKAEFLLKALSKKNPHLNVLCFSNLPPAFRLESKIILYLQNALLLPRVPLSGDGIKTKLRILYEKSWLNLFFRNVDEVWVQTQSMKAALAHKKIPTFLKAIHPKLPTSNVGISKKYSFITVSGTAPHKRLKILLDAWELFGSNAPSLLIITDKPSADLMKQIDKVRKKNVEIRIDVSREEIFEYYQESKCLIITSKIESFCLPLYEAKHFKLKILAPNESYVNDFGPVDGTINLESKFTLKDSIEKNLSHLN